MAPQTAISKAVCYKTKNEQLWEKAVHFLFVATNCFYAGLPTDFCTITPNSGCFVFPNVNTSDIQEKRPFSGSRKAQSRHSEPFGVARAACFEQLAGVLASCGALHWIPKPWCPEI